MPPLPSVPNVLKLVVSGKFEDSPWINIYYLSWTGSSVSSPGLAYYLANAVEPAVNTAYGAAMGNSNEATGLEVTDLSSDIGSTASQTIAVSGSRTGDFAPASAAFVISHEIERRYRGGHPRSYLPWGTAGTYETASSRFWDEGFVTASVEAYATMIAGFTPGPVGSYPFSVNDHVNVSYYSANARREAAVVDNVVSYVGRQRICSQRRRLGKTGG